MVDLLGAIPVPDPRRPGLGTAARGRTTRAYFPAEGLAILFEHQGLDAHPDAWKGTAAYKMLNETSLGAMLEDIATQVADRALRAVPGTPITGKEAVGLLIHLARKGFAVGLVVNTEPPQPRAVVVVIRDAARNEVFKQLIGRIPPLNAPRRVACNGPAGGRSGYPRRPRSAGGMRRMISSSRSPRTWSPTRSPTCSTARPPAP